MSEHVNPTGPGYIGTASVDGVRNASVSVAELPDTDIVHVRLLNDEKLLLSADPLDVGERLRTRDVYAGSIILSGPYLDLISVRRYGQVRLYETDCRGAVAVVSAYDDPFLPEGERQDGEGLRCGRLRIHRPGQHDHDSDGQPDDGGDDRDVN